MAEFTYLNFDLVLEKSGEKFRARVQDSPAGQAEGEFGLPFSDLALENFFLRIGRPRRSARRLDSPEMEEAKKFGAKLFEAVFENEIYAVLQGSLIKAENEGKGVRLRLRVNSPELTDLPWEYLYNPRISRFLSLSVDTPIVRYLELPQSPRPLNVKPPIKILAMISSPYDYQRLDVEKEWNNMGQSLDELVKRGLVTLDRLEKATLSALQRRLRKGDCHILHFIGHGSFDGGTQEGVLLLEDENGRGRKMSGQALGTLLHNHRQLRLAVLNACEGARTSRSDPFAGVAQTLVQQGIPAVIAMQFEITDPAAITFSHEFYAALADGYPVDAALAEARTAIFSEGNDIEWGTPVYFTRAPDGRVFNVRPLFPDKTPLPLILESAPDIEKRLAKLYDDGLSAFLLEDWARAMRNFQQIVEIRGGYKDASQKLAEAKRQFDWADLYAQAVVNIKAKDWRAAQELLEALHQQAPDYKDVTAQLAEARKYAQLDDLYIEATHLHKAGEWQAVVKVFDKMKTTTPNFLDPLGLLQAAKVALAQQERETRLQTLYREALQAMSANQWEVARRVFQQIQTLEADYRDTRSLLDRVDAELARNRIRTEQISKSPFAPRPLILFLLFVGGGLGLMLLLGLVWLGSNIFSSVLKPTSTPPLSFQPTDVSDISEEGTLLALTTPATQVSMFTPTSPPLPEPLEDDLGVTMRLVSAGIFEMGKGVGFSSDTFDHAVFLDSFYIDQTEVTNAFYARCVDAGVCVERNSSELREPGFAEYPVRSVTWNQAKTFCEWRGARLPSEAEWEKAARGGLEGMNYPWGNTAPDCTLGAENGAQFNDCGGETIPVSSFAPNGYGLYDMAGNVWEWVADYYQENYYTMSPMQNPIGPETGDYRVLRGGSWSGTSFHLLVKHRYRNSPSNAYTNFGFRCARSP